MFEKLGACVVYKGKIYHVNYYFNIIKIDKCEYAYYRGYTVGAMRHTFSVLAEKQHGTSVYTGGYVLHMKWDLGGTFNILIAKIFGETLESFREKSVELFEDYLKRDIYLQRGVFNFLEEVIVGKKISLFFDYD